MIFDQPLRAAYAGLVLAAVVLLLWLTVVGVDGQAFVAFLLRYVHVLAAMVWVGLIVFINFVQLEAVRHGDEQTKAVLHQSVVPDVAWWVRHSSTLTVLSGVLLLLPAGYALPSLVYGTAVYVPPSRSIMLWLGVLAAVAMWMFVHMYIWPNMQVVLGRRPGDAAAKAAARGRVVFYARLNLILALPVVLVMVAAAHLY